MVIYKHGDDDLINQECLTWINQCDGDDGNHIIDQID